MVFRASWLRLQQQQLLEGLVHESLCRQLGGFSVRQKEYGHSSGELEDVVWDVAQRISDGTIEGRLLRLTIMDKPIISAPAWT
jgi:hypothetical protein